MVGSAVIQKRHSGLPVAMAELRRFASEARHRVGAQGEIGICLMDDADIRRLNQRYRGVDEATDVLSFPAGGGDYLGDVAISLDTAERQAREQGHALEVEVRILLLHGLLHLMGYNHDVDRGEMQRREWELRRRLGLPPGLIERQQRSIKKARSQRARSH